MTGFYQWMALLSIYLAENTLTYYYVLFLFLRNNLIL